jgi:hypothetical protein
LSTQTATLIASSVSAVAALLVFVGNLLGVRSSEARAAHRRILEPHLPALGRALHEVVASSVIAHRRVAKGQDVGNFGDSGIAAAEVLKDQRLEVKYSLRGIDEGLRTLSRLPNWAATYRGDASGDELIRDAQSLAAALDDAIARSYGKGRPPGGRERRRISHRVDTLRDTWKNRFNGFALTED